PKRDFLRPAFQRHLQTYFTIPTSAPTTPTSFPMSILPPQDLLALRHSDIVADIEDKMDSMKSATGLSTDPSRKSGEEPLSGQKGQGTVNEPYDQGNAEGSEGAPAKQGVTGLLDDAKRKAQELMGKGS
ncbi:MAG: hypothetical protein Q9175_005396, partial [Cornicularia normoerica]